MDDSSSPSRAASSDPNTEGIPLGLLLMLAAARAKKDADQNLDSPGNSNKCGPSNSGSSGPDPSPGLSNPSPKNAPKAHQPSADPLPPHPKTPPRPQTPTRDEMLEGGLRWLLFWTPHSKRLGEALYERGSQLPPIVAGNITILGMDEYRVQDTVENILHLLNFLKARSWSEQKVQDFLDEAKLRASWPHARLQTQEDHQYHAWRLFWTLLAFYSLKTRDAGGPYPENFSHIVQEMFPSPSQRSAKPKSFPFTIRDLLEVGLIVEPTDIVTDHLTLRHHTVKIYALGPSEASYLLSYDDNKAAVAVGLGGLGKEWIMSYSALLADEKQETYKLPISLGIFEVHKGHGGRSDIDPLTLITSVIRCGENNATFDRTPHLLAGRVMAIEEVLRARRRWYSRLRRDISKRSREEPWMFWGAVLAVFFGICTVIQTVTSVWSLVLAADGQS